MCGAGVQEKGDPGTVIFTRGILVSQLNNDEPHSLIRADITQYSEDWNRKI